MHLDKEIKYSPGFSSGLLTIFLLGVGVFSPWIFKRWMPKISPADYSPFALVVFAAIGAATVFFVYEYYRYMITKMMDIESTLIKKPKMRVFVVSRVTRWQAVSIYMAPFTDLTLVALLMMVFGNSWLIISFAVTFLTVNLLLSVKDIIISYRLIRYVRNGSLVRIMPEGFEVWKEGN